MFFLLSPRAPMQWVDLPESILEKVPADTPVDLAALPWKPTSEDLGLPELPMVGLALRSGIACSKGVVVGFDGIATLHRLMQVLQLKPTDSTKLPHADLMEQLLPGWRENRIRGDAAINESRDRMVAEARAKYQRALDKPYNPELVAHWRSLGGVVPE
ncbi:hypothetical protein [Mycolicibacterium murale]|nr:hypothetical protein [Mycolicibacterium murale]